METKLIASQLRRSYEGEAWHGPALSELLKGVSAEIAAARPIAGTHSIWELVLHIEAWAAVALAAVQGKPYDRLSGERDWPSVPATTNDAWNHTMSRLQSTIQQLVAAVRTLDEAKLSQLVEASEFSYYFLLHGLVQHNLYHAGQIALLKKAAMPVNQATA